jgi:periplasmic divalent cation tolerance protein
MDMQDLCLGYVTCTDPAQAERIGRGLLEARLAACVNLIPGMRSLYWWEGRIDESHETVLIVKTTRAQQEAVIRSVAAAHSYQVPCVVFLPIEHGHAPYLDWLRRETGSPAD